MMQRVVHVISTPHVIGGAERVVSALVEGSADRGWSSVVINPFAQPGHLGLAGNLYGDARYEVRECFRLRDVPATVRWLNRRLREFGPDIVHTHLIHATIATACSRHRASCLVSTHHHGSVLHQQGRRALAQLDMTAGRRFDRVVAVSPAVQQFLLAVYRYPPTQVELICNGWRGSPASRVGLADRPTVVCVANLRREKGHEVLLDAFALVRHAVPGARLVLVGAGDFDTVLRLRSEELGISEDVEFVGAVDDVWPYLAQAHVFALPSRVEPFGIAALEAMAAGLPVVASAVGGIVDLVKEGATGRLVPPGDPAALAHALAALLSNPDERNRLGSAGRATAGEFRLEKTIDRYFRLYETLIAARTSR